jgi:hypothetical protein
MLKRRRRRLVIRFSIGISFGAVLLAVILPIWRMDRPQTQVALQPPAAQAPTSSPSAPMTARTPTTAPPAVARVEPKPLPPPPASPSPASPPFVSPPRESAAPATDKPPMAGAPLASTPTLTAPPAIASPAAPRAVDSEETYAKKEIESLVRAYCAALEAMEPAAVLRMMPGVSLEAVQTRLAGYRSLKCTVTLPAEFERIDIDPSGSGHAQLKFRLRQEHVLKAGPATLTDTIAVMTVSRSSRNSPWVIEGLVNESNRK